MHYLGSFVLRDMLLHVSLQMFAFNGQKKKFSESMPCIYIVTCPAVYLELFTSWGFFSEISFLALFVLLRFFFGDTVILVIKRAEK